MALLNYVAPGSYTKILNVSYSKFSNVVTVEIAVFSDATKTKRLGTKFFDFRRDYIPPVCAFFLTEPPIDLHPNSGFITASYGCKGVWDCRDNLYAYWNGDGWQFWTLNGDPVYYDTVKEKYYRVGPNNTLCEVWYSTDFRIWDKYFNFSDPSMNILKSVYRFLKTQPLFEVCEDA